MEASALQAPAAISRFSISAPLLRLRSDEQLVALFRSGSEEAFRAIHERYRARLLAYARQMLGGSRQDAEDALQDVFFRAYGALRANDRPVALRAWLYRVAHNRCIDQLRRPVPAPSEVLEVSRLPQPDPPAEIERREDLRRLVADVGRLPDQQRSALLMRELQGLSYEELSESLQVSVAAVKSLLVRARGGLLEAADARDTACGSVRDDLTLACDRGVRASGLARRHMRDCAGCREYRDELRGVSRRIAALTPVGPLGPLGLLAKGLGLGGSGAAAGGAATGGAALGGAGSLVTVTKVALVCAAAVTAGGAIEVARHAGPFAPGPHSARVARPAHVPAAPMSEVHAVVVRRAWAPAITGGTPAPLVHNRWHASSAPQRATANGATPGGSAIATQPAAATHGHGVASGDGLKSGTGAVKNTTSGSASAGSDGATASTGSGWAGDGSATSQTSGYAGQTSASGGWGSAGTSTSGSASSPSPAGSSSSGTSTSTSSSGSSPPPSGWPKP